MLQRHLHDLCAIIECMMALALPAPRLRAHLSLQLHLAREPGARRGMRTAGSKPSR